MSLFGAALGDASAAVTMTRFDGTTIRAAATIARLKESVGQLNSAFSRSGLNVWADVPRPETVETITLPDGDRHRVLDRETVGTALQSTRFQLRSQPETSP